MRPLIAPAVEAPMNAPVVEAPLTAVEAPPVPTRRRSNPPPPSPMLQKIRPSSDLPSPQTGSPSPVAFFDGSSELDRGRKGDWFNRVQEDRSGKKERKVGVTGGPSVFCTLGLDRGT